MPLTRKRLPHFVVMLHSSFNVRNPHSGCAHHPIQGQNAMKQPVPTETEPALRGNLKNERLYRAMCLPASKASRSAATTLKFEDLLAAECGGGAKAGLETAEGGKKKGRAGMRVQSQPVGSNGKYCLLLTATATAARPARAGGPGAPPATAGTSRAGPGQKGAEFRLEAFVESLELL